MNALLEGPVRFGTFELDLRTGELRKAGVRISLPEQPYQVLKALLDRPGNLVTRDELRQRLWPAETFVDFEHGLNAAVRRLRDALGDSADVPRFVETLPRRGYRFIAPVAEPPVEHEPAPPAPVIEDSRTGFGPPGHTRAQRRHARTWGVALVAAMTLVSAMILWASGYLSAPAERFKLAVLPFGNLTGDPDEEYFSDGITDELITQLGMIDPSRLGVIAAASARQYKSTSKRANQIGAELGASYILEGSVKTDGSLIRIDVRLIDTPSESQLWVQQYEQDVKDLLTLQRRVGEAISQEIMTRLGFARSTVDAGARRHSTSDEYVLYLRGRHHWRKDTALELDKAKEFFLKAIDRKPSYALAHSGLADTYMTMGGGGFLPMHEAYKLGRAEAQKAVDLDDTLAEAHTSLASISSDYDWDWAKADRRFKRAVTLNPNYETALRFYSFYLAMMGRHQQALGYAVRAKDLDPVSADAWANLATVHYFAHHYDEATKALEEALELDSDYGQAHVMLGRIDVANGLPDRAVEHLERAKALQGSRPGIITPYAYMLAKAGRTREARAMLEELQRIAKPGNPSPFRLAFVHIGLGETDEAFDLLEKALGTQDWQMGMLKVEPAFDVLRSDERFARLLERVGLPR